MRQTVTVVIPTFNAEKYLDKCLNSVKWADEIIIVDMYSTDRTLEICKRYPNIRIFQRKDYIFSNVNFGIDQAKTDWIIRVDSDEILNEELQREIQRLLSNPKPDVSGYYFRSIQYMFGKPMRYGVGLRERCIRKCMFRKGVAHYECKSEHEDITTKEKFKILDGYYEHFTNETVADFIEKVNYYVDRDIERMDPAAIKKPKVWKILYRAPRMFLLYYIQMQGYKDGLLGFFSSIFRGPVYIFINEAKRWEIWAKKEELSKK